MGRIVMELLIGKYAHTIDDKSRLTIPSKIRNKMGESVYISKGFEGCLEVRTPEEFSKYTQNILNYKNTDPRSRMLSRQIFANSELMEIDKAGRIRISAEQIKIAGLNKDVYVIGVVDHWEIWDREKYDQYEKNTDANFETAAAELGKDY
ncbi:Transcriptional regulator MraZ [Mesoplasma sp. JKS002658]|nr:Transcriptional regulator MraZ [Mesoplasma sp. JKS002664]MCL8211928.1 Transcriptional regulator MraZ [Mesoplasma sp. JKS002662]MCL8212839.1 Transcriptional regulator MraZ [Mesoplasma sp. JKS002661]MCL8213088.1 Transcriptional regulator MraZ [Mesoplasma sp. JKS002660]MCL8213967.1 Transcriptional regulator MraZ [Mesoplasma sp. JKS002658]MCL8214605.1 Transcriptional regulator MraZ [Mesoplasma sp. JKS002663]MCL8215286.1 Transcriptional regulator MraZ [Mesoplasma sp. JKS002659]MCL8216038.1 Tra